MICKVYNKWRASAPWSALFFKTKPNPTDVSTVTTATTAITSDKLELKPMSSLSNPFAAARALQAQSAYALLPGEHADITIDIRELIGNADQWLSMPNSALGGHTPNELIGTQDEQFIRDILRAAIYSGIA